MPLYEVGHSITLNKSERDELAQAITLIHTRKFTTPSLFVNVRFVDSSNESNYLGGKERSINRILAYVRSGGTRTTSDFDDLAQQVQDAWDRIITRGDRSKERELNRVFILGTITTGMENGFLLPRAGEDTKWLKQNAPKFEELANQGDPDFIDLVEEMRTREDLASKVQH